MTTFKISEIQANPFRHIERYPYREDKIAALRESLRSTGFWDNMVARVVDGKPQIAYGHHRLEALRREYKPGHQVTLIIRDLSDDQMLKIMARENMEEWGTSAAIEHETVRAVIEAYAEGRIDLPGPSEDTSKNHLRYAPSFVMGGTPQGYAPEGPPERPYTAEMVADFLGWTEPSGAPKRKVRDALAALQFIEEGIAFESDFAGLGSEAAHVVIEQARAAWRANQQQVREARQQADQAEREVKQAERQRAAAERERQQRLAQMERAKEQKAKERAEKEARDAERRAAAAEREQREAAERQQAARKREAEGQAEAKKRATTTARHVSRGLKSGRGTADAGKLADEVRPQREGQPPPHIDDAAFKLAARINRVLMPDADTRVEELEALLKWQRHMSAAARRELSTTLANVVDRAETYRRRITLDEDVIDAEVVEDEMPALPAGRK